MNYNSISDFLFISLEKCLNNVKTHLNFWFDWEICDYVKKRFKSKYVADILGCLEDYCQEITKGLKYWGVKVSNIFKEITKPLKNETIESVFFISR